MIALDYYDSVPMTFLLARIFRTSISIARRCKKSPIIWKISIVQLDSLRLKNFFLKVFLITFYTLKYKRVIHKLFRILLAKKVIFKIISAMLVLGNIFIQASKGLEYYCDSLSLLIRSYHSQHYRQYCMKKSFNIPNISKTFYEIHQLLINIL